MPSVKSVFFVGVLFVTIGTTASCSASNVYAKTPLNSASTPMDVKAPGAAFWHKLTLTYELPDPFNKTKIIMRRSALKGVGMVVSGLTIIMNGHEKNVPEKLLSGLAMPRVPGIIYLMSNMRNGKLSSFVVQFKYGRPLDKETKFCHRPGCVFYRIARFSVDNNYNVTREEDWILAFET